MGDGSWEWEILDSLTLINDSFTGSCAVVKETKVFLTGGPSGSRLLSFDLQKEQWLVEIEDIGISAKRHGCTLANIEEEEYIVLLGGDYELVGISEEFLQTLKECRFYSRRLPSTLKLDIFWTFPSQDIADPTGLYLQ